MAVDAGSIQSEIKINLDALKKDLLSVEKLYDNLDAAINKSTANMAKEIDKVTAAQKLGAISQTEASAKIIKIKQAELTQLKTTATESGKASDLQISRIKTLEAEIDSLSKTQTENTTKVKAATKAQDGNTAELKENNAEVATSNASLIKQAAAYALVAKAVTTAKTAISIFSETEQSLANVKAVTNATAAEFEALEQAALDAGETTRFTAREAADALFYLSSAGLDAQQSTAALGTTLELAGATGSDLASTAQSLTATMSQYNIEAEDAARISNIFAAANSNSQATMEKLTGSLRQVGSVAGLMNISLEETVGSLELLYNAGYQGEAAGRALKSALADLANESSVANTKLAELGISFDEVNPAAVGLTEAIGVLEENNITAAQALDIFGKVAGPQLATLIGAGKDEIIAMTEAVTDTDEAARQYGVQNDTLAGSVDKLKSAAEGLAIAMSSTLAPVIRTIADAFTTVTNFVSKLPDILVGAGTGAATAAVGFVALSKGLALVGVTLTGPIGLIAAAGAIAIGLVGLNKTLIDGKDRTDELASVTQDLVAISDEYSAVTKTLKGDVSGLTKAQKAELETRQQLLALDLEKKLVEYAEEYSKLTEQIEKENQALEDAKTNQEEKLAYYDKLNTQETRIAESKEKLIALEKKVADGSATAQEVIMANTLSQALEAVANSENERIRNRERMVAGLNEEIVASEKAVNSAKTALLETQAAGQASINAFAKAYNEGNLSIELYKTTNKDLYDQIVAVAAEMKTAEGAIDGVNDSLDDDSLDAAVTKWEEYLKAILGVDTKGSGVDAANSFIDGFDREMEASKTIEEALNGNLDNWDPSSLLQTKADSIGGALQDLFAIDPETIDETFTTTNEAVQVLVDSLRETQGELNALAESEAAKELDSIGALTTKRLEALANERDYAIQEAERQGIDTAAIYQTYEDKKTAILEDAEAQRSAVVSEFLETEKTDTQLMLDELTTNWQSYTSVVTGLISSMIDANAALIAAQNDAEIEAIETLSQAKQDAIDDEAEALIESLGIAEETTLESLERLRAAAEAEGDAETAQEYQDEYDRTKILEDAEAAKAVIEEEAAAKTAALEYESELASWEAAKASALFTGAQAVIGIYNSLSALGPIVAAAGAAVAAGYVATNYQAIVAAKPVQSFATGGIVFQEPGKASTGDQHQVNVNPKEMILTEEQQANLFNMLNSGYSNNSGGNFNIYLGGKQITDVVVKRINNGQAKLL